MEKDWRVYDRSRVLRRLAQKNSRRGLDEYCGLSLDDMRWGEITVRAFSYEHAVFVFVRRLTTTYPWNKMVPRDFDGFNVSIRRNCAGGETRARCYLAVIETPHGEPTFLFDVHAQEMAPEKALWLKSRPPKRYSPGVYPL
jgi:hypothetical protein